MPLLPSIKKISTYVIILFFLDIAFSVILWMTDNRGAYNLDGTYNEAGSTYIIRSLLVSLVFVCPFISALLGLIIGIFIHRDLPYGQRFLKASLIVLTVIYAFIAMSSVWQLLVAYVL